MPRYVPALAPWLSAKRDKGVYDTLLPPPSSRSRMGNRKMHREVQALVRALNEAGEQVQSEGGGDSRDRHTACMSAGRHCTRRAPACVSDKRGSSERQQGGGRPAHLSLGGRGEDLAFNPRAMGSHRGFYAGAAHSEFPF